MKRFFTLSSLVAGLSATAARAQDNLEIIGRPVDGKMGFQPAVTGLAEDLQWLDGMILVIITLITLFVTGLILWVAYRYNAKRNPTPASFTHHTPVEIAWTVIPIVILLFIGAYSLPILFNQQEIPEADVTIKVTGYQWYWDYEYVDDGFEFSSYMIGAPATGGENMKSPEVIAQLEEAGYSEEEFLLATDTSVVVPVNKTIVMQVTGGDVIHAWTIPAFGVKQDAVPGRLAELWFKAEQEGIYFGQCSELCGLNHSYMPITVKVVSEEAYAAWLAEAKEEYAGIPQTRVIASN
ncbi:cytochrome c oxidase subunit II [Roseobacter sp.]|uniref:cytochrome c oxidase subunit II n=1 Tax=Roseobacter sp. TaxID=1907202 RepID=UPI0038586794